MNIRPLLNRRPLQPGESLSSLWVRLQAANYYRRPQAIAAICRPHLPPGENFHLPHLAETWPVLAAVTRLPAADLYSASFHRYASALALPWEALDIISLPDGERVPLLPARIRRFFLRPLGDAQYCPTCLANGRYHRLRWLNLLTAICPHHACLLQCGCPNCSQKLPVSAIVAAICPACTYDLTTTPPISVSDDSWGLWVHHQLQSWWGDTSAPPLPDQVTMPEQPVPILLEVLRVLATVVAKLPEATLHTPSLDLPLEPVNLRTLPTPLQVYCTYATAMKAMVNWPQAFHQFLAVYRQRPGVAAGQVTDEFSPLYLDWLEERWQRPEFAFIQAAFDDFLVANYPLSRSVTRLDRYRRSQALRDRFPYLTQAEAAERLGVEPEIVQRLVDERILVDYERGEGQQRHWHQRLRIVRRLEFVDLQRRWQAGIPLKDGARILDVNEQIVESLVKAALLTKCGHTGGVEDSLWPIETISLNTLVRGLKRYPVTPYHFGSPVTLWELVENGYDPVRVLQQVLAGEVTAVWLGGGLYSLWVSRNDIHLLQK